MANLIKLLNISHEGNLTNAGHIPENELRRQFNLGSKRIASLSPARDPFFTIVAQYKNRSTDDPEFKHIEEREIWHRRYGFIMDITGDNGTEEGENHFVKSNYDAMITAGETNTIEITSDYDTKGRFSTNQLQGTSIFDNAAAKPTHFFKNQVLKIPVSHAASATGEILATGDLVVQINSDPADVAGHAGRVGFTALILRHPGWTLGADDVVAIGHGRVGADVNDATGGDVLTSMRDMTAAPTLQTKRKEDRVQIIGSSYEEASGLPNTSYTDRLHDTFGFTQIFKTDLSMSNTALATMLKYRPNEYAHRWNKTMLQHKRDINLAGIWGIQSKNDAADGKIKRTTQGCVDFVMNNGWVFSLDATKDYDGFLEDLSEFYHPEVAQQNGHMFHVSTNVFNWFNRLNSGFIQNTFDSKSYISMNLQFNGMKKFAGFHYMELGTPHGTMRMVKDVNLDGTGVKILGINYNQTEYRPLVGNGLNRDTKVYLKVKDVSHTGEDYRTDLVQTEAGFEFGLGETFAMWT